MVLLQETIDTVFKEIIKDKKIMDLMSLPVICNDDTESIKAKKMSVIKKAITFSSQNPNALGGKFQAISIEDKTYSDYAKIRMTICNLQSENLSTDLFGRLRLEINLYHLNEDTNKVLKIINLIAKKFSERDIYVEWVDDTDYKHISRRQLSCRGIITQIPNINNYEKSGIRFAYYGSYYSSY